MIIKDRRFGESGKMSAYDLSYLIRKIEESDFQVSPFRHIYLENFFSEQHFDEIIRSMEIRAPEASNDAELIEGLCGSGFKIINFPGCVTDKEEYIEWHENGKVSSHHSACEGFGMALRLYNISSPILKAVNDFIAGDDFNRAIAQKFGINFADCSVDCGIQKYLDGYEISPHPDIRRKAATYMVNINPDPSSEIMYHHTHYMRFDPSKEYVRQFWKGNPKIERAWVPWDWATTEKLQDKNNSIVLFSPSDDTLHAVKADYNHLKTQRTQLYGNLWYREDGVVGKLEWESLDLAGAIAQMAASKRFGLAGMRGRIGKVFSSKVKKSVRRFFSRDEVGRRDY